MNTHSKLTLDLGKVAGFERIAEMQRTFRERLKHTVVFMGREASILIDEQGDVPKREGQRPHPCEHCRIILDDSDKGAALCHRSDLEAAQIAEVKRAPLLYRCWTNKSNVAIPITVGKTDVIGNLYAGQFFAVVENEKERNDAEEECSRRGFIIHDGKGLDDKVTINILPGFFWTYGEVAEFVRNQDHIFEKATIKKNKQEFFDTWNKIPLIPYKEAIASVELLQSIANTFATIVYANLAYRLSLDLHSLSDRCRYLFKKDYDQYFGVILRESDQIVQSLNERQKGEADAAQSMTNLLVQAQVIVINRIMAKIKNELERKKVLANLSAIGVPRELSEVESELSQINQKLKDFS
jgi:ligand-binding sensor protein